VDASYRTGNRIVVATFAVSFAVCLSYAITKGAAESTAPRAAENLGDQGFPLGAFRLTERSGKEVTGADLDDGPWVASFIFTRCPLSCPRISSVMKGLQGKLEGTDARLVSISVDPEHDTPEVLAAYARRFDADPDRWWFLTGPKDEIFDLVRDRFKLSLFPADEAAVDAGAEAFSHSDRLALVHKGSVVGYFDSNDPERVAALVARLKELGGRAGAPSWAKRLPALNAGLNGTCAVLLVLGWTFIRSGKTRAHAATMIASVTASALFLGSYLVYHYHVGSVAFRGTGPIRLVYLSILLSHTVLATFGVVPLVLLTLTRAARKQFSEHARVARVTFPIWLYVSVTGVVIYLMLYQMPIPAAPTVL